jgi:arsenate reductase (thioredoxin)
MTLKILFLCPHGVAKSVMAAAYTLQYARAAGLVAVQVSNAGTELDDVIPSKVIDLLASDGIDISGWSPNLLTQADLERADRVISLGCDVTGFEVSSAKLESWGDVPSPSVDLRSLPDTLVRAKC